MDDALIQQRMANTKAERGIVNILTRDFQDHLNDHKRIIGRTRKAASRPIRTWGTEA
jgi:hypothetical protein